MFGKLFKMFQKDDRAFAPLMGVVTLLIGVIVVLAIGTVVLTQINASTYDATSDFTIDDLADNWVMIAGLVLLAVLAIVGFFIIRLFGSGE